MLFNCARPLLFALDPERAHGVALNAIEAAYRLGLNPLLSSRPAELRVQLLGLDFANPVGLAAGLDKNGAHIDALASLGFGFIEVGTVTPRAQPGNPRPRVFRLPQAHALINRLGFNNGGLPLLLRNLESTRYSGVLGINIGKNKNTPNHAAAADYLACLRAVYARASYVTVNISSPNTAGLRDLQHFDALKALLSELRNAQLALAGVHAKHTPMLVKVAPDLSPAELDDICEVVRATGFEGIIATNTTLARTAVAHLKHGQEAGGLSGAPVFASSTAVLAALRARLPEVVLIGVGGILSGADAKAKMQAGAQLLQFYTGMLYRGPALIAACLDAIREPH